MVSHWQVKLTLSSTNEIRFKDLTIEHVCKTTLKHSYISIKARTTESFSHPKILLKTPNVSKKFIFNLLEEKETWIRSKLAQTKQRKPQTVNLEDEVLLFGEIYSIDVGEAEKLRELLQKNKTNSEANILKCYDTFYKEFSKVHIIPKVEYFSKLMGLEYEEIKFKKMRSRWGSCSSKKIITLNTNLLKIPNEYIDYVVVHELAHLVHMNHSKNFHALVLKYIPHATKIRKNFKNLSMSGD